MRQQILDGLTQAARLGVGLAVAWHVLGAAVVAAILALVWRPSRRKVEMLLAAPLASVSVMAWLTGNPFNGVALALLAVALLVLGAHFGSREPVGLGSTWSQMTGAVMLSFGFVYPHFLEGRPELYLIAAPLGVIPCPTLSALIGAALLGVRNRPWSWTLAAAAICYGLIGVFFLGVWMDLMLLAGAAALVVNQQRASEDTPARDRAPHAPPRAARAAR